MLKTSLISASETPPCSWISSKTGCGGGGAICRRGRQAGAGRDLQARGEVLERGAGRDLQAGSAASFSGSLLSPQL
jgi:predicted small secreted protein